MPDGSVGKNVAAVRVSLRKSLAAESRNAQASKTTKPGAADLVVVHHGGKSGPAPPPIGMQSAAPAGIHDLQLDQFANSSLNPVNTHGYLYKNPFSSVWQAFVGVHNSLQ